MKKAVFVCLTVLLLCFVFQISYGVTPSGIVWGPENQGLRMNLRVESADSNQADVYKVVIQLINVGTTPVVLAAQWDEEKEKGDYYEFFKKQVEFTSFPEAPSVCGQTALGPERTSPQPTLEIKPGNYVAFEWVTAPRRLKPEGYFGTTSKFLSDGLYSIRAKFIATLKNGNRILLYSNDCQLAVGGSTAMPKFAMARIIEADSIEGKVRLNLGSDQKIEPNDKFRCCSCLAPRWDILITEVKPDESTGSVKNIRNEPLMRNVPVFPGMGSVAVLTPVEHRREGQQSYIPSSEILTYESKLEEVKKKAERIAVGMKRSEVEQLFREKDGGIEGPSVSRYYEHPEVMIEIPFDQTGGNWNPDNRVTGKPKIYRSPKHLD